MKKAYKAYLEQTIYYDGTQKCFSIFYSSIHETSKHVQPWPVTLLKKSLWHRCFPVNFAKFLRTSFSQNTSGRRLLHKFYHKYYSSTKKKDIPPNFLTFKTLRKRWSFPLSIYTVNVTKSWVSIYRRNP